MMTSNLGAAWILLGAVVGCSSHGSQTSSSSHWVRCSSNPDCANVALSVACEQGYCVDANHQRIDGASASAAKADVASCDAAAALPSPSNAAQCSGGKLEAANPITITTPDPAPSNPTLASSPSGDRFLALWTDGGGSINDVSVPETVWISTILPGATGVPASAAVEVSADGACPVAAWTGPGFAVAWGDAAGLHLQLVDVTGATMGAPSLVLPRPNVQACPTSIMATSSGLAIAWYEGQSVLQENVGLVGASGGIGTPVQLATVGPGVSANVLLGVLADQTYAAFVEWPDGNLSATAVVRIDWSRGAAVAQGMEPGFLGSLVVAGGQLVFTTDASGLRPYGITPGAAFPMAMESCSSWGASLASDGCGRIVRAGDAGPTPAGISSGFFVQPVQSNAPPVELGVVTGSAIVGAQSTFGVLWYARIGPGISLPGEEPQVGTLSFTTLSWR